MSTIQVAVLSSLYKAFPEVDPQPSQMSHFSCLKNEPLSFQIGFKLASKDGTTAEPFNLKIESELPISVYSEGAVPVSQAFEAKLSENYRSGLFYDILYPKTTNSKVKTQSYPWQKLYFDSDSCKFSAAADSWKFAWLVVNEDGKNVKAGNYKIKLQLTSRKTDEILAEAEADVEMINCKLPKQKLIYTRWFHCDCLCDTYHVPIFSERFWEIFRNFVKAAVKNGQNMIFTPMFTPPLDTPVGEERLTAQLVEVEVKNGAYVFDFSLLKRFLDESRKCGITYFEHSHLFTQWGATSAPKIMATVDGKYKRIFGWDTKATGKKYVGFLRAYLPKLLEFLDSEGLGDKVLFHISDEPNDKMIVDYRKAKAIVADLLQGRMSGDALSHYEFYEDGTVTTPIVCTDTIHNFFGKCDNLWAYYTGGQCSDGMSNSKLNCSNVRNRILGIELYRHKIKGFLQWGYNYYYDQLSQGIADPKTDTCFYAGQAPGTSFFVYPGTDGTCLQSIRQKVFYEAINDMRALEALEKLLGRKKTEEFLESYYGKVDFHTPAGSEEKLLGFREALNCKIKELSTENENGEPKHLVLPK